MGVMVSAQTKIHIYNHSSPPHTPPSPLFYHSGHTSKILHNDIFELSKLKAYTAQQVMKKGVDFQTYAILFGKPTVTLTALHFADSSNNSLLQDRKYVFSLADTVCEHM